MTAEFTTLLLLGKHRDVCHQHGSLLHSHAASCPTSASFVNYGHGELCYQALFEGTSSIKMEEIK